MTLRRIPGPPFRRRPRNDRALSDVIGTILLLGLTVTLFGTVFVFVNTFPRPPAQPTGQFDAWLTYAQESGVGEIVSSIDISHLAGPTIFSGASTQIWLSSAEQPTAFPTPFSVGSGLSGASSWSIGEVWSLNVTSRALVVPNNITISLISQGELLYHEIVPGSLLQVPPQFGDAGTVPSAPAVGAGFLVYAPITDPDLSAGSGPDYYAASPGSVEVNYSLLPGFSGAAPQPMSYSAQNGTWEFEVPTGTTSSGIYYLLISARDDEGFTASVAVPVDIVASASGGSTGGGPSSSVSVSLSIATPPVRSVATTIEAFVADTGTTGGSACVSTFVGTSPIGSTTCVAVGAGGSAEVGVPWTPSTVGNSTIVSDATISGVGSASGALTVTVFPRILFVAMSSDYTTSTMPVTRSTESAWFEAAMVADDIPFTPYAVSCTGALPSAATLEEYSVVLVDFGSNGSSSSGCYGAGISAANQATLESAIGDGVSVGVFGADLWPKANTCPTSAFLAEFGLAVPAGPPPPPPGAICTSSATLPSSQGVYTAAPSVGLEGLGLSTATYTVNSTIAGAAPHVADTIAAATNASTHSIFTIGGTVAGAYASPGHGARTVLLGFDPAMLVQPLPLPSGSEPWGTGAAAAELIYNLTGYLGGISAPGQSSSGRAGVAYAVSEVAVEGQSHTSPSTVEVAVRSNGLTSGVVTVTLLVNGVPALYVGNVVSTALSLPGDGSSTFVTFTWQAPSAGSYQIEAEVTSAGVPYTAGSEFGTGILAANFLTFS